jgi:hypothetical protein
MKNAVESSSDVAVIHTEPVKKTRANKREESGDPAETPVEREKRLQKARASRIRRAAAEIRMPLVRYYFYLPKGNPIRSTNAKVDATFGPKDLATERTFQQAMFDIQIKRKLTRPQMAEALRIAMADVRANQVRRDHEKHVVDIDVDQVVATISELLNHSRQYPGEEKRNKAAWIEQSKKRELALRKRTVQQSTARQLTARVPSKARKRRPFIKELIAGVPSKARKRRPFIKA